MYPPGTISNRIPDGIWLKFTLLVYSRILGFVPRAKKYISLESSGFHVLYPRRLKKTNISSRMYRVKSMAYSDLLTLTDELIMQELQAGNADAFAVVFRRYHRLVHVTALRILRDAAEAEDITQTVFLEIYRNARQFDSGRGSLKVWLLQYAYSRSANRRNYLLARQIYHHVEVTAADEADTFWSPRNLQFQETSRLITEALSSLPDVERNTIELFFFEGLTFKEIAAKNSETYSNVRHYYYRGIERLRISLEARKASNNTGRVAVSLREARPC